MIPMHEAVTYRLLAYTSAAGKYNPDAVNNGNEDNFFVDDDLSDEIVCQCNPDELKSMSDCGLLMVVADGMGGMNAGEVASDIAVSTVGEFFAPGKITGSMASDKVLRKKYLEDVIVAADKRIRNDSSENQEHYGMGSTIIMAWIVGNEMTISWCGDSRAYRFNERTGLELLSEDHSYVQELVRNGLLTYEQTFDHPQNNIVTRSLGSYGRKVQPETREFIVYDGDFILLCSDGLNGVLRDKEAFDEDGNRYDGDTIEDIIRNNASNLRECKDALWTAAQEADWYDNVTTILCKIESGAGSCPESSVQKSAAESVYRKPFLFWLIPLFALLLGSGVFWYLRTKDRDIDVTSGREVVKIQEEKQDNSEKERKVSRILKTSPIKINAEKSASDNGINLKQIETGDLHLTAPLDIDISESTVEVVADSVKLGSLKIIKDVAQKGQTLYGYMTRYVKSPYNSIEFFRVQDGATVKDDKLLAGKEYYIALFDSPEYLSSIEDWLTNGNVVIVYKFGGVTKNVSKSGVTLDNFMSRLCNATRDYEIYSIIYKNKQ